MYYKRPWAVPPPPPRQFVMFHGFWNANFMWQQVECLQMLQRAGLPCDITTQGAGLTLAHVAALEGQGICLAWLCQNGISVNAQVGFRRLDQCTKILICLFIVFYSVCFQIYLGFGSLDLMWGLQWNQCQWLKTICEVFFNGQWARFNHFPCKWAGREQVRRSYIKASVFALLQCVHEFLSKTQRMGHLVAFMMKKWIKIEEQAVYLMVTNRRECDWRGGGVRVFFFFFFLLVREVYDVQG